MASTNFRVHMLTISMILWCLVTLVFAAPVVDRVVDRIVDKNDDSTTIASFPYVTPSAASQSMNTTIVVDDEFIVVLKSQVDRKFFFKPTLTLSFSSIQSINTWSHF